MPAYVRRDNLKNIKERERLLDAMNAETHGGLVGCGGEDDVTPGAATRVAVAEAPMTVEQALRIVQIHERARQGRLRAKFMADIRHAGTARAALCSAALQAAGGA